MKLKTNVIIISIIIVVLLGSIIALSYIPEDTDVDIPESVEDTSVVVLNINDDIVGYKYTSADEEYEIVKDGIWYVKNENNIDLSQILVSNMIGMVSHLSTTSVIEEDVFELEKYGLSEPINVIWILDKNKIEYKIQIGDKTSTESGYYAKIDGDNRVFIIADEDYKIVCGGLNSLRSKNIVSIDGDVVKVSIKTSSTNMAISRKESENINAGNFSVWEMISPYKKDVNQYIFEENVLNALNFSIDNFVDDNPKGYEIYGLAKPQYSIEVVTNVKKYKFYFGKTTEDGMVYFKTEDAPNVYSVHKDLVKFKDFTPVYLLESLVFSRNISAVEKITFIADGTYVINISKDMYKVNGKKVDETKLREAYRTIISPVIQGEAEKAYIGNEICRFTFEYNTGTSPETVVFYEYNKMYSAVSINGKTDFYVKKSYIEDMINSIKGLIE